jgi:hypothetical protein
MRLPSLQQFFRHQLQQGFHALGLREAGTIEYVSEVLARFAHTRALHAVRDADGRPLEYIVDMLVSWQQAQDGVRGRREGARERTIMRHIGDYTLFMSGLFRERLEARGELGYYVAHGRSAFWRSADYEPNPTRRHTYRQLYRDFNPISDMLDYLRRVQLPLGGRAVSPDPLAAYWRA